MNTLSKRRSTEGAADLNRGIVATLEWLRKNGEPPTKGIIEFVAQQLKVVGTSRNETRERTKRAMAIRALVRDPNLSNKKLKRVCGASLPTIARWKKDPWFNELLEVATNFPDCGWEEIPRGPVFRRKATITCPHCHTSAVETMPTDRCQSYKCRSCGVILQAKPGDCCVYCAHADQPCQAAVRVAMEEFNKKQREMARSRIYTRPANCTLDKWPRRLSQRAEHSAAGA